MSEMRNGYTFTNSADRYFGECDKAEYNYSLVSFLGAVGGLLALFAIVLL